MQLDRIRAQSIQTARELGARVPATLPLLEDGLRLRPVETTVLRVLAMYAVAAVAFGFERAKAVAWLHKESLAGSLTEPEARFVFDSAGPPGRFRLQFEAMWALAWALGVAPELDFAEDCDARFVSMLPNLKECESSGRFRHNITPRLLEPIVAACDLAYCLHWAIRESELAGAPPPGKLKHYLVVERRRALEWLLSAESWDEVSLDT